MKDTELYWLAGILEGEGSFMKGPPCNPTKPIICMVTTDKDIADRVGQLLGVKSHPVRRKQKKPHWKNVFGVRTKGVKAVAIMQLLKPLMGERRQLQIQTALNCYSRKRWRGANVLSEEKIQLIRSAKGTNREIGEKFGVDHSTISRVKRKISYSWLD